MCEVDYSDYEPYQVWKETKITARKSHKCNSCHGSINPKEGYTKHFSVFDGDVNSAKMCYSCAEVADEYAEIHGIRPAPSGVEAAVYECLQEEQEEGNVEMVAKWSKALSDMEKRRECAKQQKADEESKKMNSVSPANT